MRLSPAIGSPIASFPSYSASATNGLTADMTMLRLAKSAALRLLASLGWRLERIGRQAAEFYPVSKTCQIPTLSTIYERLLGRRRDGVFVEVGAYDGESF